jgi:CRISPR-associated protein Csd2
VIEFPRAEENNPEANQFDILVRQGNIVNDKITKAINEATRPLDKKASDKEKAKAAMEWLCRKFYDVRTFGGVLSTGQDVLKGSAYGDGLGPSPGHVLAVRATPLRP